jgi:LmbE family N-acetylglucosaminyl deacetylase
MLRLDLTPPPGRALQALFLGAHGDDIELGCGATMLDLVRRFPGLAVTWLVLSATAERRREVEVSAERFLAGAGAREVLIEDFRDGYLPYDGGRVKDRFETLKRRLTPDVIFTPYHGDAHQDHRFICELTWNTFRDHLILEYEVPKYDPEEGAPNVFVPVDDATAEAKARHLLEAYPSQAARPWFTRDTILAVMHLRGVQARAPHYAEAFHARRLVLGAS